MWIVSQIGAREHYAIPRALERVGQLGLLCTDAWIRPGSPWGKLPGSRRLRDRYHTDLAGAPVFAPNARTLAFEIEQRLRKRSGWESIIARNTLFQQQAIRHLSRQSDTLRPAQTQGTKNQEPREARQTVQCKAKQSQLIRGTRNASPPPTLFSYSCAALELFRFAKARGWGTVLGQIDPGPEEERLVGEEHRRYQHLKSSWKPTPAIYWDNWRKEVELADRILVNSEWSRQCLLKEGVPPEKMEVVPLVYEEAVGRWPFAVGSASVGGEQSERPKGVEMDNRENRDGCPARASNASKAQRSQWAGGGGQEAGKNGTLSLLFLGQINLRKGVGRLLEAMRLLKDESISLTLAGPCEIDPATWSDLPKVKWVGPVPRSEVGRYYAEADLFILPTISDGYALTQLEALYRGLPVLASKSCGAAVTHGVNGWILDDLEPDTIAQAILDARKALPLAKVEMPPFSLDDLARALRG